MGILKPQRTNHLTALFAGLLVGSLLTSGCAKKRDASLNNTTQIVPTAGPSESDLDPNEKKAAEYIAEKPGAQNYLVAFNKEFWVGRTVWVSLGVERASVSGLALSVMGYVPATLKREGSFLVLERKNKGLYGGSVLGPELPINSYPIVSENPESILVDLSQPQNAFALTVFGLHAGKNSTAELTTRMSYLKNVQIADKHISFTTVLTAKSPIPLFEVGDGSPEDVSGLDPYILGATLRTDWVLEIDTPNFQPFKANMGTQGFFLENPLVTAGGLQMDVFVSKINTQRTFEWAMSANTPKEYQAAVAEGITAWNEGLGGNVLKVRMAEGGSDFTDPRVSNIVWDDNLAIGMAFANWRSNPYTGEIVQAQVYMSGKMWAENSKTVYRYRRLEEKVRKALDEARRPKPAPGQVGPAAPRFHIYSRQFESELADLKTTLRKSPGLRPGRRLGLAMNAHLAQTEAYKQSAFCVRTTESQLPSQQELQELAENLESLEALGGYADSSLESDFSTVEAAVHGPEQDPFSSRHSPFPAADLTEAEFAKNVVRGVVLHEVGHTLGLRHNFKGSTKSSYNGQIRSASIMDYNDLVIDAEFSRPGEGDLYIMSQVYPVADKEKLKAIPFCTDEDARKGQANCVLHDYGESTVAGARVATESNLLMSQFFMNAGHPAAIRFLVRALGSWAQTLPTLLQNTSRGNFLSGGENFSAEQTAAWELYQNMKNVLGLSFDPEVKEAVRFTIAMALAEALSPAAKGSHIYPLMLDEMAGIVGDAQQTWSASVRILALQSLQKIQDLSARNRLVLLERELNNRLTVQITVRDPNDIEEDSDILARIQKILRDGYLLLD